MRLDREDIAVNGDKRNRPPGGFAARSVAVGLLLVLAVGMPARATIRGPQSMNVSCDGTSISTGVTVTQASTGTYKVTQNSTNPISSSRVYAVSSQGNSLSTKTVSDGGTVQWTSVLPSNYTTKVFRSGAFNCNGIGLGHGNYAWNYTVTYQG